MRICSYYQKFLLIPSRHFLHCACYKSAKVLFFLTLKFVLSEFILASRVYYICDSVSSTPLLFLQYPVTCVLHALKVSFANFYVIVLVRKTFSSELCTFSFFSHSKPCSSRTFCNQSLAINVTFLIAPCHHPSVSPVQPVAVSAYVNLAPV